MAGSRPQRAIDTTVHSVAQQRDMAIAEDELDTAGMIARKSDLFFIDLDRSIVQVVHRNAGRSERFRRFPDPVVSYAYHVSGADVPVIDDLMSASGIGAGNVRAEQAFSDGQRLGCSIEKTVHASRAVDEHAAVLMQSADMIVDLTVVASRSAAGNRQVVTRNAVIDSLYVDAFRCVAAGASVDAQEPGARLAVRVCIIIKRLAEV